MTKHIFSSRFSIDNLAIALEKISINPKILFNVDDFDGSDSVAFREGLVEELNSAYNPTCPNCDIPLEILELGIAACPVCNQTYKSPDYGKAQCRVREDGVAEFVAKMIANGWANRTGDHYHLGEVRGRTLYYGTNPGTPFYTSHKGDVGIVLGSNNACVPEWWNGHVAHLSELFYVNEPTNEIKTSRNIIKDLLPPKKMHDAHSGPRMIHERRSEWLMFISHLFSKPFNAKDFHDGRIRPMVARDWFVKNYPSAAPKSTKQYQRDLQAFRHIDKDPRKPDKREGFIILLLRTAAANKLTDQKRMGIAKIIPELVMHLKDAAFKTPNRPINITRGAWQHCKNGTKEYIAVTDIEDFFNKLEKQIMDVA